MHRVFKRALEHPQRCSVCDLKIHEENPKNAGLTQEIGFGSAQLRTFAYRRW
jgi:hypothetical protein